MKDTLTENFTGPGTIFSFRFWAGSRYRIGWLVTLLLSSGFLPSAVQSAPPALPQVSVDTTYTSPGGNTISVAEGDDLQSAIDNSQPGDILSLAAGATFTGNFTLPNKSGASWIVIRTSAPDTSLPSPGTRITPEHSASMPKIVSPNTSPAISTAPAAHHYRFIGVEIATTHANTGATLYSLTQLGNGSESSTSELPSDIIFDRCYIHGTPMGNIRRGIALNGARIAVIDSHLSEFHEVGNDSQAIMGWNGPGPFKIVNNYLEGAGENLMFGGTDPSIANLVPSDIEIRANHIFKPLKWKPGDPSDAGIRWVVKNLFELKNARRVLIEGNVFEHNWPDAQNGFSILFTVRNQDGSAPWSVVEDVSFTNNIVRHVAAGINILGRDDISGSSQQTKRILIENNLFDDIGGLQWGNGRLFQVGNGAADVTIDHNTAVHTENVIFAYAASTTGFIYRNNLTPHNEAGVVGDGAGTGTNALNSYFPGYEFNKNVLAGGNPGDYPPDGYFPASMSDVGFVNLAGGDYRLAPSSPYKSAGTDGKDLGADVDAILAATKGKTSRTAGQNTNPASGETGGHARSGSEEPPATQGSAILTPAPLTGPVADPASGGPGVEASGCFIATAAYGSPLEPKVVMLRHFRDHYLLTHAPGRAFVKWYYRVSPPVAEAIRNSIMLRIATQITLWPLVALVWCVFNPETGVLVAFLAVIALAAGGDVPRRKSDEPFVSGGQEIVEEIRTFVPQSRREIPLGHIPLALRALPHNHNVFHGGFPSKKYVSTQRPGAHKGTRRRKKVFAGEAR